MLKRDRLTCLRSHKDPRLLPGECRHLRLTYKAPVYATLVFNIDGVGPVEVDRKLGNVPLMVKTRHCHLHGKTQSELVKLGEEPYEFGGYFIANGNEKAVRLLSMQRYAYQKSLTKEPMSRKRALLLTHAHTSGGTTLWLSSAPPSPNAAHSTPNSGACYGVFVRTRRGQQSRFTTSTQATARYPSRSGSRWGIE